MNRHARWITVAVATSLCALSFPESAPAFNRTQSCEPNGTGEIACDPGQEPKPIAWPSRCVRYQLNQRGSSQFSDDNRLSGQLRGYVRDAFETWNEPSCSDFTLVEGPLTSDETTGYDESRQWNQNHNIVVWQDDDWNYDAAIVALTFPTWNGDGEMKDADITVNTTFYEFTRIPESEAGETDKVDITNTLTHEVGHFIGLAHTTNPEATMHGGQNADLLGEIKKRSLHADDIDGLCTIYPGQTRDRPCQHPEDFGPPSDRRDTSNGTALTDPGCSGCSAGGGSPSGPFTWLVGWCLWLGVRCRSPRIHGRD